MSNQDIPSKDAVALRERAEARACSREGQTPEDSAALSPLEIHQTFEELRVHQIELQMQNEELRAAQQQIEAKRSRYFEFYNLAPVGYLTLSDQGLILEANLACSGLMEPDKVIDAG